MLPSQRNWNLQVKHCHLSIDIIRIRSSYYRSLNLVKLGSLWRRRHKGAAFQVSKKFLKVAWMVEKLLISKSLIVSLLTNFGVAISSQSFLLLFTNRLFPFLIYSLKSNCCQTLNGSADNFKLIFTIFSRLFKIRTTCQRVWPGCFRRNSLDCRSARSHINPNLNLGKQWRHCFGHGLLKVFFLHLGFILVHYARVAWVRIAARVSWIDRIHEIRLNIVHEKVFFWSQISFWLRLKVGERLVQGKVKIEWGAFGECRVGYRRNIRPKMGVTLLSLRFNVNHFLIF